MYDILIYGIIVATAHATCRDALRQHKNVVLLDPCPELYTESTPAAFAAFANCPPLPHRECITPAAPHYPPPNPNFRHFPSADAVLWPADGPYASFADLAARKTGDCVTCWRFQEERVRWRTYIAQLQRITHLNFSAGTIRTCLDLGAGVGGFMATMADNNVACIGTVRNWRNLPFLETIAARGLLAMHVDFRNQMPFGPAAFDLVHCAWLLNIIQEPTPLRNILIEWDRIVRPGGYIVQYGFRSEEPRIFKSLATIISITARNLKWTTIHWRIITHSNQTILFFIYQKPTSSTPINI